MSKTLSVRIPDDLAKELDAVSKNTERSRSFLIKKALEAYLDEQVDLQIAFDRLHDTTDPVITIDQMREELDL